MWDCSAVDRDPSCPTDTWAAPTASIFNDVHTVLASLVQGSACSILPNLHEKVSNDAQTAVRSTNLEAAVLLGHSFGATVAIDIITGELSA